MLGISPHISSCGYSWGNICIAFWGLCICLCVNGSVFFVGFYRHWTWSLSSLDSHHDWFMLLILDWGDPDNFWQCLNNNFIFTFLSNSQNNQHFIFLCFPCFASLNISAFVFVFLFSWQRIRLRGKTQLTWHLSDYTKDTVAKDLIFSENNTSVVFHYSFSTSKIFQYKYTTPLIF